MSGQTRADTRQVLREKNSSLYPEAASWMLFLLASLAKNFAGVRAFPPAHNHSPLWEQGEGVTTAARNVVDWGRACGLAELALQPARRYQPAPVSSFLSVEAACWISGRRKERHSQERKQRYVWMRWQPFHPC
jgi:hypothetical protein